MTPPKTPRYTLQFKRAPEKLLNRLPRELVQRLTKAIDNLAINPRPRGVEKMEGYDYLYRIRVGDWRIIYAIEDDQLIVLVIEIGHRSDVYRNY